MSTVFIVRRFLYKRFKFIVRMFLKKYKKDLDFPSQRLLSNYKEYERVKYSSGKKDTWEGIMSEIDKQNKSRYKRIVFYCSSAAAVLLVILLGLNNYFVKRDAIIESISESVGKASSFQNSEGILLVTSQGCLNISEKSDIYYDPEGNMMFSRDNGQLEYLENNSNYPVRNELTVPRGKRAKVTLSDGTTLQINSETTVIYPSVFDKGKREIYVDGEVFLNVTPDISSPFFVQTERMRIKVLGTSFNVSSYASDEEKSVVLVSGKVEVNGANKQACLLPDQMFLIKDSTASKLNVKASDYVSWTQNMIVFHREPLNKVFHKLSRYYGIDISCSSNMAQHTMSGKLDLKEDLKEVMEIISEMIPVRITVEDDKLIIELV